MDRCCRLAPLFVLWLVNACCFLVLARAVDVVPNDDRQYLVIGVSGGLQDGFPDHTNLDYHAGQPDESRAIFLGRALVRGYKAFLDVMQEGWRQYTPEPGQPLINCNVFASGCHEHANQYWIYIVDARQVMSVLNNEPRFLSITPDTGMLELDSRETQPVVREFVRKEISKQGKSDMQHAALPLVTAVWFHESHVPSPPIRTHADGTDITNFPESLALWAGVDDSDRTALLDRKCDEESPCSEEELAAAKEAEERYWDGIRAAVRNAEENRPSPEHLQTYGPPFECNRKVRFGVANDTARVNYHFTVEEITSSLRDIGYGVDYVEGEIYALSEQFKEEL